MTALDTFLAYAADFEKTYGDDAAMKYKGFSANGELFYRFINDLHGNGPIPVRSVFHSPASNSSPNYEPGDNGWVWRVQMQIAF